MHQSRRVLLALLLLVACGVPGATVKVKRTADAEGVAARPPGCALEFLWHRPERAYDELGDLTAIVRVAPREGDQEVLRDAACALGADAVIVIRHSTSRSSDQAIVAGTAIKYVTPVPEAPTPPVEQASPAAPPGAPPAPPAAPGRSSDLDL